MLLLRGRSVWEEGLIDWAIGLAIIVGVVVALVAFIVGWILINRRRARLRKLAAQAGEWKEVASPFLTAIIGDTVEGPAADIMSGLAVVKTLPHVDAARVGISGWSYGGQMTTWMIGHYNIFKVAVAGAPVTDLVVDYAIADDILDDRAYFGYSPNDPGKRPIYRAQSPITYAANIHTPTLLMSNVYDVRVPAVENYELYHALRDRGVPVKFYVYPTTGHLPKGPVRYADAYKRWLDWFDAYLHPTAP